jgi:hypothetical protein
MHLRATSPKTSRRCRDRDWRELAADIAVLLGFANRYLWKAAARTALPSCATREALPRASIDVEVGRKKGVAVKQRFAGCDLEKVGFCLLPEFITGEDLLAVKSQIGSIVSSKCDGVCKRPNNDLYPLRWNDVAVETILSSGPRMHRLALETDAADLKWISGYVSVKPPHSSPLWWHQDWWCWDHPASFDEAPIQMALLCYLSDTTPSNGALRVLPGSHRRSSPLHGLLAEVRAGEGSLIDAAHPAFADQDSQVSMTLRAGDAVVIDYRLLHGTHANAADTSRNCIILNFTPSWKDVPADIRGHLIMHSALPSAEEDEGELSEVSNLLPRFDGARATLPLARFAPANFGQQG